ncbi:helicase-related protein [Dehalobacter sp. TeCB1]|uniref:DEAD/DEAH box helicase n=1 Tax=Dehalobacter sp. TeCB1 TaxID=1843715 RepID=UPI000839F6AB|nr:helicase-related protein [Dehalobacter sp. TeCB1]OCZ51090.1 helicase [Dehalobacter sp. TeCB1]
MNEVINSTEQLIIMINDILKSKKDSIVNIINDKLTLSVFSELAKNLKNVKEINFIIRDTAYIPSAHEIAREFEMSQNTSDLFFNSYDIIEKNKLKHFVKAKSMYDFIKKNVNVRKTKTSQMVTGNIIIIDDEFQIQGSSSLEISKKASRGTVPRINFDTFITNNMDKTQIVNNKAKFEVLWNNNSYTEDYKEQLLQSLSYVYKDYSPEFLYYFTLNELFGSQLDNGIERFERDSISFKKSKIWSSLFEFQKDAVVSAIQKINKYNGCIIADSVGLGKTFEALAVIKYFELRQDNVLVLTPAKLYDNWNSFKSPYTDNAFINDRFNYKILFHTDLSRTKGESKSGLDLSRVDWSKFDLIVIDESHNFRNRTESEDHMTRYQRLMYEVIKKGHNTKVLLLSATPVNNSLTDLKNQLSIITADKDHAFEEYGIESVSNLLRKAQKEINVWIDTQERAKSQLLDKLPSDFFKLLEMLTISRSRKHITGYYGNDNVGRFPNKMTPDTYKPEIDEKRVLLNFEETNEILESLKLAVYAPMGYIKSEYKEYYRQKYQTVSGDRVLFYHENRELITAQLHRFNLFKRLESSVFAFGETIRRLIARIDSYIEAISRCNSGEVSLEGEEFIDEDVTLDYKYEIKVEHLITGDFLQDLYYDKEILDSLYSNVLKVLNDKRDEKLKTLQGIIIDKITQTPYNPGNRKILIFSAFADTANYLYNSISQELSRHGIHTACVSGSGDPKTTLKGVNCEFNNILRHFSPRSKMGQELPKEKNIDVLIGTDCISEGQNLQDCDCVINYDIQWNPVVLIQRFGRIDRIGSQNANIAMVNFFPNVQLNDYLQLEQRVQGKMMAVNLGSTGDEHLLSPEMNDFLFRKKQLERLQKEVIDMDDLNDNISLTDLNMNDYLYELSGYIKDHPEIRRIPRGIYSLVDDVKKGCIFCFRHQGDNEKPKNESSLYPYYIMYMTVEGEVFIGNANAREALKEIRKLCYGKCTPDSELFKKFNKVTRNAEDMSVYSSLLSKAISAIQGEEDKKAQTSIFDFGGYNNEFANSSSDDFELISFLVVD